jgi:hypothetical protein
MLLTHVALLIASANVAQAAKRVALDGMSAQHWTDSRRSASTNSDGTLTEGGA